MCNRKGIIGKKNPGALKINSIGGNGTSQKNCTDAVYFASNNVWPYPVDGCVGYHDPSAPAISTGPAM